MKFSSSSRINAFDILRGWCLIVISSDHLLRFPSFLDPFTGRGLLWVTAAEGFFFISGTLVGIVQGRRMLKSGLREAMKKMWMRAAKLYAASMVLTLLFTVLGYWAMNNGFHEIKGGLGYFHSVWDLIWQTFTLQYSYGWADFLNYYVVYLLVAPVALWLCQKGWWWMVALASLGLWLGKTPDWPPLLLAYCTWQSYFFLGLVFGYYFEEIRGFVRGLQPTFQQAGRQAIYGLTAVTVVVSFALTFGTEFFTDHGQALAGLFHALSLPTTDQVMVAIRDIKDNQTFTYLFQDNRTGLLRLPLFGLWFAALFLVVRRYEHQIVKATGWLLLPLGKNSLYVYILQSAVVFGMSLLVIPPEFVVNSIINIAAVLICWVAVRQQFLFKVIPR